jgi:tetratricopeptide (TPR) repeat protein
MQVPGDRHSVKNNNFLLTFLFVLPATAFGMWFSLRTAFADRLYASNEINYIRRATRLMPDNAGYHALLAEHLESQGADPKPELLQASRLNPLNSLYLGRLAIRAESENDMAASERFLRQAAAVDKKLLPQWDLLNFYFRRGNESRFWEAFRRCLEISSEEDSRGIFNLAWAQSQDPEIILKNLPGSREHLRRYLNFLLQTERTAPAVTVANRLAQVSGTDETPLLLIFCERALRSDSAASVRIWNILSSRKLISSSPLDPARGEFISNKSFSPVQESKVFDWEMPSVEGVFVSQSPEADGVTVHFDGTEPENAIVLRQAVPLLQGSQYRLSYEFSAPGTPVRGLYWEIVEAGAVLAVSPEIAADANWSSAHFDFPAAQGWAYLTLRYHRPAGAVRAEGSIGIRKLSGQMVK